MRWPLQDGEAEQNIGGQVAGAGAVVRGHSLSQQRGGGEKASVPTKRKENRGDGLLHEFLRLESQPYRRRQGGGGKLVSMRERGGLSHAN